MRKLIQVSKQVIPDRIGDQYQQRSSQKQRMLQQQRQQRENEFRANHGVDGAPARQQYQGFNNSQPLGTHRGGDDYYPDGPNSLSHPEDNPRSRNLRGRRYYRTD